jgi:hypothetical protein
VQQAGFAVITLFSSIACSLAASGESTSCSKRGFHDVNPWRLPGRACLSSCARPGEMGYAPGSIHKLGHPA